MTELRAVVGSGPSAIAVTHALLERGFEVLMLDVGETLDVQTAEVVARMAEQEPEAWSQADRALIQRADFKTDPALSPKRAFGSPYAYFMDPKIVAPAGMRLYGSRAFGGLSTVWGCALLRANPGDLSNWPKEVRDGIAAAYPRVRDLIQQCIGVDIFASDTHLRISRIAESMLDRHRRSSQSRAAVDLFPTPLAISDACKSCNACMYGCVYGFTYSSRTAIQDVFMKNARFRYINGVVVERYRETEHGVEIYAAGIRDQHREILLAKQLFLAAGTIGSLRILWKSSRVSRKLSVRDSSCFIVPGFVPSSQGLRDIKHHGLSHLSVDLKIAPFESKVAHAQLYFNNPAIADGINARLGALAFKPVQELVGLSNRFVVAAQGYLHSDFCHRLRFECNQDDVIQVSVERNSNNQKAIDAALLQLTTQMRKLGMILIKAAANITPYGGSKTAGALPHAFPQDPATTDLLGRPVGAQNVFVVDGAVLPSIPARNHTLTMMANALRIGQSA